MLWARSQSFSFFFFNDTATTEIYTLSLHDALPISRRTARSALPSRSMIRKSKLGIGGSSSDRKSTRLNSSHGYISYAGFFFKKKKKIQELDHSNPQHTDGKQSRLSHDPRGLYARLR